MKIIATQKNVRQAPRKVRLVANSIKELSLTDALKQLAVIERRASLVVLKVVKQAIANAMNNHQLLFENLAIQSIEVTPGATYKRWNPVSRGRAHSIFKRTSHVKVILETQDEKKAAVKETEVVAKKTAAKPKKVAEKKSTSKGKTK